MYQDAWFDEDDALLGELGQALASAGPIPSAMLVAARSAFAWRDVDRDLELLSLAHESSLRDGALMRGTHAVGCRTLVFEGHELSLDLEVTSEIVGQVIPPQPCRIVLRDSRETLAQVDADALGCFRLALPDRGPLRLTCSTADRVVATDWWRP
jgi:hypothetical protein